MQSKIKFKIHDLNYVKYTRFKFTNKIFCKVMPKILLDINVHSIAHLFILLITNIKLFLNFVQCYKCNCNR